MTDYLTREVFDEHKVHVDGRFDAVDRRLIGIEAALIANLTHQHGENVRWGGFIASFIAMAVLLGTVIQVLH